MVIEKIGQATGNVIRSSGEAYQTVTEGLPWPVKAGLIVGGIAGGGYLTYYLITQLTGAQGGSCTTPGTPCYEALQPYQQSYQICANEYSSYLDQYLKTNSANGTGFTTAQLDQLNYLSNCMNTAANSIAQTAKKFAPENPLVIVAYFAGIAAVTAVGLYFGAKGVSILRQSKNFSVGMNNGFQAQQALNDACIQTRIGDGTISRDQASGLNNQYKGMASENITYANQQVQGYVADEIITTEEATTVTAEMDTAMADDATITEDELIGLFE